MSTPTPNARGVLSAAQLDQFIHQGFVQLDEAFSAQQAAAARALLWPAAQLDPDAPSTWTRPAIRLGMFPQPECVATANTPRMRGAFDQLVGEGRWLPCRSVGTFRIALPLSLVHAAQAHHGAQPRILAQPPLLPAAPLRLDGPSPVERAIQLALRT